MQTDGSSYYVLVIQITKKQHALVSHCVSYAISGHWRQAIHPHIATKHENNKHQYTEETFHLYFSVKLSATFIKPLDSTLMSFIAPPQNIIHKFLSYGKCKLRASSFPSHARRPKSQELLQVFQKPLLSIFIMQDRPISSPSFSILMTSSQTVYLHLLFSPPSHLLKRLWRVSL